jgi:hypothetical protein
MIQTCALISISIACACVVVNCFFYFRKKQVLQSNNTTQNESIDDCVRLIAAYTVRNRYSNHLWISTFNTQDQFDGQKVRVLAEVVEEEEVEE